MQRARTISYSNEFFSSSRSRANEKFQTLRTERCFMPGDFFFGLFFFKLIVNAFIFPLFLFFFSSFSHPPSLILAPKNLFLLQTRTALSFAAEFGQLQAIAVLLNCGAKVDCTDLGVRHGVFVLSLLLLLLLLVVLSPIIGFFFLSLFVRIYLFILFI